MGVKTIIMMRHGQVDDYRQLTPHGISQVQSVTSLLLDKKIIPDVYQCSPTDRTKQTADICLKQFQTNGQALDIKPRVNRGLEMKDIPMVIAFLPDKFNTALLISHEPDIQNCLDFFVLAFDRVSHAEAYVLKTKAENWESATRPQGIKLHSFSRLAPPRNLPAL